MPLLPGLPAHSLASSTMEDPATTLNNKLSALKHGCSLEDWVGSNVGAAADGQVVETHLLATTCMDQLWDTNVPWDEARFCQWLHSVGGLEVRALVIVNGMSMMPDFNLGATSGSDPEPRAIRPPLDEALIEVALREEVFLQVSPSQPSTRKRFIEGPS